MLRQPAPLELDLRIEHDGGEASLLAGTDLLATAKRTELAIEVPEPPSLAEAEAAEARFDKAAHIYPGCFVCGSDRDDGDGWRIFPGAIGEGRVAAAFTAPRQFADADGALEQEFIWAALDCPGYFAVETAAGLALLGRMAVMFYGAVPASAPLIVQGWAIGSEGRKHRAGTAIHDESGRLLAAAQQVWVSLR